jgi:hypothetical protein
MLYAANRIVIHMDGDKRVICKKSLVIFTRIHGLPHGEFA